MVWAEGNSSSSTSMGWQVRDATWQVSCMHICILMQRNREHGEWCAMDREKSAHVACTRGEATWVQGQHSEVCTWTQTAPSWSAAIAWHVAGREASDRGSSQPTQHKDMGQQKCVWVRGWGKGGSPRSQEVSAHGTHVELQEVGLVEQRVCRLAAAHHGGSPPGTGTSVAAAHTRPAQG